MIATTFLYGITEWATVCGFIFLMLAALITPWLGSRRTEKRVGTANGAHSSKVYDKAQDYNKYNLYDLVLQGLVNSEEAKDTAKTSARIAANATTIAGIAAADVKIVKVDVKKIVEHLGIE
jgi:hypothetical protein